MCRFANFFVIFVYNMRYNIQINYCVLIVIRISAAPDLGLSVKAFANLTSSVISAKNSKIADLLVKTHLKPVPEDLYVAIDHNKMKKYWDRVSAPNISRGTPGCFLNTESLVVVESSIKKSRSSGIALRDKNNMSTGSFNHTKAGDFCSHMENVYQQ